MMLDFFTKNKFFSLEYIINSEEEFNKYKNYAVVLYIKKGITNKFIAIKDINKLKRYKSVKLYKRIKDGMDLNSFRYLFTMKYEADFIANKHNKDLYIYDHITNKYINITNIEKLESYDGVNIYSNVHLKWQNWFKTVFLAKEEIKDHFLTTAINCQKEEVQYVVRPFVKYIWVDTIKDKFHFSTLSYKDNLFIEKDNNYISLKNIEELPSYENIRIYKIDD